MITLPVQVPVCQLEDFQRRLLIAIPEKDEKIIYGRERHGARRVRISILCLSLWHTCGWMASESGSVLPLDGHRFCHQAGEEQVAKFFSAVSCAVWELPRLSIM